MKVCIKTCFSTWTHSNKNESEYLLRNGYVSQIVYLLRNGYVSQIVYLLRNGYVRQNVYL